MMRCTCCHLHTLAFAISINGHFFHCARCHQLLRLSLQDLPVHLLFHPLTFIEAVGVGDSDCVLVNIRSHYLSNNVRNHKRLANLNSVWIGNIVGFYNCLECNPLIQAALLQCLKQNLRLDNICLFLWNIILLCPQSCSCHLETGFED